MQKHSYAVIVDGTPAEVWQLFWYRGPRRPTRRASRSRSCTPATPWVRGSSGTAPSGCRKYLLTGGVGKSWEWLTEVEPPVSWKYDAVGKPLYPIAEGRTRLEDLGDGRTKIHFSETYHAFNPVLRALLERRVHRFISKDNDRLITTAINEGIRRLRAARDSGTRRPRGRLERRIVTPRNLSGTTRLW